MAPYEWQPVTAALTHLSPPISLIILSFGCCDRHFHLLGTHKGILILMYHLPVFSQSCLNCKIEKKKQYFFLNLYMKILCLCLDVITAALKVGNC